MEFKMKKQKTILLIPINRRIALIFVDILGVLIASFAALFLRFEFSFSAIEERYIVGFQKLAPFNIVLMLVIYFLCKLYKSVWRYASATEFINIIIGSGLTAVAQFIVCKLIHTPMPRSYYVLFWFFLFGYTCVVRFSYRLLRIVNQKRSEMLHRDTKVNVMLIGAGAAANSILAEIETSRYLNLRVQCIIDDDAGCQGKIMRGVPIVGTRDQIPEAVHMYHIDEIIYAIPSASAKTRSEILQICKETGCILRTLPGMYQMINGDVSVSNLQEVAIEDLLGREPIQINSEEILGNMKGKTIMVTGGGGSIGSELCRQIASHEPERLIIVDIYENNAYEIQQELLRKHPELNLVVLIASVRNTARMDYIFDTYRPDIVFHAAAHKHVPLMEDSPNEAIKNNVFGTYKTAMAADKYGVEKFVLISTDKAVNPTNIMGASKRICEMIIQMMSRKSKTNFVAVRFGNVLGSNGSVIPLFKKQIAEGGPVTVTHPDIIRYFMTISEAVSLILQASVYAKGGEIFVLDMGEPMKIDDLAKNLIKLSGFRVGEDIEIQYIGLRPGEKMYEELLMGEEGLKETDNKLIHIGKPLEFDADLLQKQLQELGELAGEEHEQIRSKVKEIVPTYKWQA